MSRPRILVVEDEGPMAKALGAVCERLGCEALLCGSARRALKELASGNFALIILDIGLPDTPGWTVQDAVNRSGAASPVLVITARGTLDNAVAARQHGAAGYLVKPLDLHELERVMRNLISEPETATTSAPPQPEPGPLLGGASSAMQQVFMAIAQAAATDAPVIITGPTGTGKTVAARVIHSNSSRRNGPFVTLLCGAMPENLLESELFGHEKNAFTGAGGMRSGHLERARGGTLFLDEIGDIPLATQAKLLRFVDEKAFTRVGGREDLYVDLRLLTATNRSLRGEVQAGRFREDLYYRLHVLEVEMPALAKRRQDIPLLASYFVNQLSEGRQIGIDPEVNRILVNHSWPGNVRELRNAIERAVAICSGKIIQPHHLPKEIVFSAEPPADADLDALLQRWLAAKVEAGSSYKQLHAEIESSVLKNLLRHFDQKSTLLAKTLRINRGTLLKRRRDLGLDK